MFKAGTRTPVSKTRNHRSVDPGVSGSNPFDSDSESDPKPARTSSAPVTVKDEGRVSYSGFSSARNNYKNGVSGANPFDSDSESDPKPARTSSAPVTAKDNEGRVSYSGFSSARNNYKNDFNESRGFENQSVQELENYVVYKAEETTHKVNDCLKIAEDISQDASRTLVTLHQQGEQISRTHQIAADMEHDLSRGEKLLGSLGGIFSKTWKPKKSHTIKGPVLVRDDPFIRRGSHLEQRERLGISSGPKGSNHRQYSSEPTTSAMQKVEVEKVKQDDMLSDLSNILGQLKGMAVDMGSEIERQNKALDPLHDDVDELNFRVKGANQRGRRLLGK